jgi:phage gp36-like protein
MQIKQDIIRLLLSNETDYYQSPQLMRAEQTAIAQIRNYLSGRYNCDAIFSPSVPSTDDTRDQFIVTITIDLTLYHLYSQSGMKDIPEHRSQRYQDALDWLKAVGNGSIQADLPTPSADEDNTTTSGIIIHSEPSENNIW